MHISRLSHITQRILELGPRQSLRIVQDRFNNNLFDYYWRKKALNKKASHGWQQISLRHGIHGSFQDFYAHCSEKSLPDIRYNHPTDLVTRADRYNQNCFGLLGAQQECFVDMPWHQDFRLKQQNPEADCSFPEATFYKDITI